MRRVAITAIVAALLIPIALLLYVYTRGSNEKEVAGRTRIVVQLQWLPGAQFLGFYVARARNYYAEEGLTVEFLHGGPEVNPIENLLGGRANIGLATADQVLITAAARRSSLKAVGTVFNQSLARFMSHEKGAITTPADFVGKRVGVFPSYDTDNLLRALLVRHKIDPSAVTVVNFPSLVNFKNGELDAYGCYVINEPVWAERNGIPYRLLDPADFGVSFYSDTIITTDGYYGQHNDELVRFVRASAKGWDYARRQPKEAVELLWREIGNVVGPGEAWQHQQISAARVIQYVGGAGPHRLVFEMERGRWENMERALESIKRIVIAPGPDAGAARNALIDELCDFELVNRALGGR